MSAVKIGPSRQVVIPKHIYDELELAPGDYLEVVQLYGKVVFTPKTLVDKPLAARLVAAAESDEQAPREGRSSGARQHLRRTRRQH